MKRTWTIFAILAAIYITIFAAVIVWSGFKTDDNPALVILFALMNYCVYGMLFGIAYAFRTPDPTEQ